MARLEEEGATKKDTLTRLKNERDAFRRVLYTGPHTTPLAW
jgi:hypothetical protein